MKKWHEMKDNNFNPWPAMANKTKLMHMFNSRLAGCSALTKLCFVSKLLGSKMNTHPKTALRLLATRYHAPVRVRSPGFDMNARQKRKCSFKQKVKLSVFAVIEQCRTYHQ
jgi:hypothetical protein